ncbi:hypothetical protein GGI12_005739 [Dipsacomyces acuminosporus]|nr:hypothetical protein GGI12_005739 [Dipsacomyces acuminosporus]
MRLFTYAPVLALASIATAAPAAQDPQSAGDLAPAKLQTNANENASAAPEAYTEAYLHDIASSNQDQGFWSTFTDGRNKVIRGRLLRGIDNSNQDQGIWSAVRDGPSRIFRDRLLHGGDRLLRGGDSTVIDDRLPAASRGRVIRGRLLAGDGIPRIAAASSALKAPSKTPSKSGRK